MTLPEEAPEDLRSTYLRDWAGRCWLLSQGRSEAMADDHLETPKEPRGVQDAADADLLIVEKEFSFSTPADEARIAKERADELRASYIRDWAGRCGLLSQGRSKAMADDHLETPAKESRGVQKKPGDHCIRKNDVSLKFFLISMWQIFCCLMLCRHFRQIRIHLDDWIYLVVAWQRTKDGEREWYVDLALPFGIRGGPKIFNLERHVEAFGS